jgi:hypothetical protein
MKQLDEEIALLEGRVSDKGPLGDTSEFDA